MEAFNSQEIGGENYTKNRFPHLDEFISRIVQASKDKDNYLDIACGTGQIFLRIFHQFRKHIVANDVNLTQLSELEKEFSKINTSHRPYFVLCDSYILPEKINEIGLSNIKFDIITMGESFHWFDSEKILSLISSKLLSETGILIILTYIDTGVKLKTLQLKDETNKIQAEEELCKAQKEIQEAFEFFFNSLKKYFPYDLDFLRTLYKNMDFSLYFKNVVREEKLVLMNMTIEAYKAFIGTWSGYLLCIQDKKAKGDNYIDPKEELCDFISKKIELICQFYIDVEIAREVRNVYIELSQ
jgi:SAM-dependent methyltransferase